MDEERGAEAAATEALAERLFSAVLEAMDIMAVYIGDRLDYYRLLEAHGPSTPGDLAVRAGTTERYVREWLEQQATTGILDVADAAAPPEDRLFSLPAGHAAVLTDPISLAYMAPAAQMLAAAGHQLSAIVDAHRTGGGVSWADFGHDMREAQGAFNRPFFMQLLGSDWFAAVPDLDRRLAGGARMADVGCGYGWSSIGLAKAYPTLRVDGYDLDGPSIEEANANAAAEGLADRVRFYRRDAADSVAAGGYDVVAAFECIHDLPNPVGVLETMRQLAAADGIVVVMDEKVAPSFGAVGDEIERLMYGFSNVICLPDGMSHPGSVGTGTVMRQDTLAMYAQEAGFEVVDVLPIEADLWRFYQLR
jgi:2-polyprenyl-3-methyl-5-hydroxy-6-metoxy-1,4-benzoquinol methylase